MRHESKCSRHCFHAWRDTDAQCHRHPIQVWRDQRRPGDLDDVGDVQHQRRLGCWWGWAAACPPCLPEQHRQHVQVSCFALHRISQFLPDFGGCYLFVCLYSSVKTQRFTECWFLRSQILQSVQKVLQMRPLCVCPWKKHRRCTLTRSCGPCQSSVY